MCRAQTFPRPHTPDVETGNVFPVRPRGNVLTWKRCPRNGPPWKCFERPETFAQKCFHVETYREPECDAISTWKRFGEKSPRGNGAERFLVATERISAVGAATWRRLRQRGNVYADGSDVETFAERFHVGTEFP